MISSLILCLHKVEQRKTASIKKPFRNWRNISDLSLYMTKENDQPISDYLLNLSNVSRLCTNWIGSNRVYVRKTCRKIVNFIIIHSHPSLLIRPRFFSEDGKEIYHITNFFKFTIHAESSSSKRSLNITQLWGLADREFPIS